MRRPAFTKFPKFSVRPVAQAKASRGAGESGFGVFDSMLGVIIFGMMAASLAYALGKAEDKMQDNLIAQQARIFLDAKRQFVRDNITLIYNYYVPNVDDVEAISVDEMICPTPGACASGPRLTDYLPVGYPMQNPLGQAYGVLLRKIDNPNPGANDSIEALMVTTGGDPMPINRLVNVSRLIGADAGFVGYGGTDPYSPTIMQGIKESFAIDSYNYSALGAAVPTSGHLVGVSYYGEGQIVPEYLMRSDGAMFGHPELNAMFTNLAMNGGGTPHDITGAKDIYSEKNYAQDMRISDLKNTNGNLDTWLSSGLYEVEIKASGETVTKPSCPGTSVQEIYVSPIRFSDNGTGGILSAVQAWAVDSGATWTVRLRVRTSAGWIEPTATYGSVQVLKKCSNQ